MIKPDASGHSLRSAYLDARSEAAANARYTTASCPPDTCRYCGKSWRPNPLAAARADGHAQCLVTPEFRSRICLLWWSTADLTRIQIAKHLGVSRSTVAAWTSDRQLQMAGVR